MLKSHSYVCKRCPGKSGCTKLRKVKRKIKKLVLYMWTAAARKSFRHSSEKCSDSFANVPPARWSRDSRLWWLSRWRRKVFFTGASWFLSTPNTGLRLRDRAGSWVSISQHGACITAANIFSDFSKGPIRRARLRGAALRFTPQVCWLNLTKWQHRRSSISVLPVSIHNIQPVGWVLVKFRSCRCVQAASWAPHWADPHQCLGGGQTAPSTTGNEWMSHWINTQSSLMFPVRWNV